MRDKLLHEAALWRVAAETAARLDLPLCVLTRTDPMRWRHAKHVSHLPIALTPLSRSLFCLLMALECEDEARTLTPGGAR